MNKYIFRTSLVWFAILAAIAGIWAYRPHSTKRQPTMAMPISGNVQPVAACPSTGVKGTVPSMAEQKMQTPLTPVQLTPERMQSIGVQTGTVEHKLLSDDIRATGTVDKRTSPFVCAGARFPGYIRKLFANATYQYVNKGEPLFHRVQSCPCGNSAGVSARAAEPEDIGRQHCGRRCIRSQLAVSRGGTAFGAMGSSAK